MRIIDDPGNRILLMSRIQCMRDINFSYQEAIEIGMSKRIDCCLEDNVLTLQEEPLTLEGEFLTLG